ncbi:putative SWI/SNF chromatin-remodeling complex subunit snf22 [Paratrimastix pyriformis]|uniref:SWI/SNF chromatin-remodeling complex subunit snf22 n=1 Tax=Paratrimastix pyriformis TaxID=342808 RepID=A0ABQ8UT29_9EUKA|nr:putative SWI/SNF chromatin-remodeling complex subunit snf22 [Paratrimastix pyriformis]
MDSERDEEEDSQLSKEDNMWSKDNDIGSDGSKSDGSESDGVEDEPDAEQRVNDGHADQCLVCGEDGTDDRPLLLCERGIETLGTDHENFCKYAFHLDCLDPPLKELPEGTWICPVCHEMQELNSRLEKARPKRAAVPSTPPPVPDEKPDEASTEKPAPTRHSTRTRAQPTSTHYSPHSDPALLGTTQLNRRLITHVKRGFDTLAIQFLQERFRLRDSGKLPQQEDLTEEEEAWLRKLTDVGVIRSLKTARDRATRHLREAEARKQREAQEVARKEAAAAKKKASRARGRGRTRSSGGDIALTEGHAEPDTLEEEDAEAEGEKKVQQAKEGGTPSVVLGWRRFAFFLRHWPLFAPFFAEADKEASRSPLACDIALRVVFEEVTETTTVTRSRKAPPPPRVTRNTRSGAKPDEESMEIEPDEKLAAQKPQTTTKRGRRPKKLRPEEERAEKDAFAHLVRWLGALDSEAIEGAVKHRLEHPEMPWVDPQPAAEAAATATSTATEPVKPIALGGQEAPTGEPEKKPKEAPKAIGEKAITQQPAFLIGGTLRDYQVEGIRWMVGQYRNGLGGILGDEMGLGKTLQVLGFLGHLKFELGHRSPSIIVCPLSVLGGWILEAQRWCPALRVVVFHGPKEERDALKPRLNKADSFDLLVTTYEQVVAEQNWFARFRWGTVVLDECQRIKNEHSLIGMAVRHLRSQQRMLLTGTPLQNNMHELWALLNYLFPELFVTSKAFDDAFSSTVGYTADTLKTAQHRAQLDGKGDVAQEPQHPAEGAVNTTLLKAAYSLLQPLMLRRLKQDVLTTLPPKIETTVYCPLSRMQGLLYRQLLSENSDIVNLASDSKAPPDPSMSPPPTPSPSPAPSPAPSPSPEDIYLNFDLTQPKDGEEGEEAAESEAGSGVPKSRHGRLSHLLMELRKCCCHAFLFPGVDPHPGHTSDLILRGSGKLALLDQLLQHLYSDPNAKNLPTPPSAGRGTPNPSTENGGPWGSLPEDEEKEAAAGQKRAVPAHRCLIYSQFTMMLDVLEEYCRWRGWKYLRLDGAIGAGRRRYELAQFAQPNSNYFIYLLSTRAGGLGLNLQSADTCVIYDSDWNPQVDRQAQDRVHRLGQNRPVTVYRLVSQGTCEERILHVAQRKALLGAYVLRDNDGVEDLPLSSLDLRSIVQFGAAHMCSVPLGETQDVTDVAEEHIARLLKDVAQKSAKLMTGSAAAATPVPGSAETTSEEENSRGVRLVHLERELTVDFRTFGGTRYYRRDSTATPDLADQWAAEIRRREEALQAQMDAKAGKKKPDAPAAAPSAATTPSTTPQEQQQPIATIVLDDTSPSPSPSPQPPAPGTTAPGASASVTATTPDQTQLVKLRRRRTSRVVSVNAVGMGLGVGSVDVSRESIEQEAREMREAAKLKAMREAAAAPKLQRIPECHCVLCHKRISADELIAADIIRPAQKERNVERFPDVYHCTRCPLTAHRNCLLKAGLLDEVTPRSLWTCPRHRPVCLQEHTYHRREQTLSQATNVDASIDCLLKIECRAPCSLGAREIFGIKHLRDPLPMRLCTAAIVVHGMPFVPERFSSGVCAATEASATTVHQDYMEQLVLLRQRASALTGADSGAGSAVPAAMTPTSVTIPGPAPAPTPVLRSTTTRKHSRSATPASASLTSPVDAVRELLGALFIPPSLMPIERGSQETTDAATAFELGTNYEWVVCPVCLNGPQQRKLSDAVVAAERAAEARLLLPTPSVSATTTATTSGGAEAAEPGAESARRLRPRKEPEAPSAKSSAGPAAAASASPAPSPAARLPSSSPVPSPSPVPLPRGALSPDAEARIIRIEELELRYCHFGWPFGAPLTRRALRELQARRRGWIQPAREIIDEANRTLEEKAAARVRQRAEQLIREQEAATAWLRQKTEKKEHKHKDKKAKDKDKEAKPKDGTVAKDATTTEAKGDTEAKVVIIPDDNDAAADAPKPEPKATLVRRSTVIIDDDDEDDGPQHAGTGAKGSASSSSSSSDEGEGEGTDSGSSSSGESSGEEYKKGSMKKRR